jgi:hypothetical protein
MTVINTITPRSTGSPASVLATIGDHAGDSDPPFLVLIVLSTVGSVALLGIGTIAYRRRRSRSYLLLLGALAALLLRPVTASGLVLDVLSETQHHFLEHALDVCIAACLLGAIYAVPPQNSHSNDTDSTQQTR